MEEMRNTNIGSKIPSGRDHVGIEGGYRNKKLRYGLD
jgi:hypothetical protein